MAVEVTRGRIYRWQRSWIREPSVSQFQFCLIDWSRKTLQVVSFVIRLRSWYLVTGIKDISPGRLLVSASHIILKRHHSTLLLTARIALSSANTKSVADWPPPHWVPCRPPSIVRVIVLRVTILNINGDSAYPCLDQIESETYLNFLSYTNIAECLGPLYYAGA